MTEQTFDIGVPGLSRIEDHHGHLLRLHYLDRCLHFASGNDDRAVDAHCLRLLAQRSIVVAAYVADMQRAAIEIIPDRSARRAQAVLTMEDGFRSHTLTRALMTAAAAEARRHGLSELHFRGVELMDEPREAQTACA